MEMETGLAYQEKGVHHYDGIKNLILLSHSILMISYL